MAKDSNTPSSAKKPAAPGPQEVSANWEEVLYAPERVEKWMKGEMTLQELNAISGPEMMEMAIVGCSMYEQGRHEDAKVIFEGMAQLDPQEAYYRMALGTIYLAQEDLEQAEKCLKLAIQINSKHLASHFYLGEVHLRQNRFEEAISNFRRVGELDPELKDPLSARAGYLKLAAMETQESARKDAKSRTGSRPAIAAAKPAATKPLAKPTTQVKAAAVPVGKKK